MRAAVLAIRPAVRCSGAGRGDDAARPTTVSNSTDHASDRHRHRRRHAAVSSSGDAGRHRDRRAIASTISAGESRNPAHRDVRDHRIRRSQRQRIELRRPRHATRALLLHIAPDRRRHALRAHRDQRHRCLGLLRLRIPTCSNEPAAAAHARPASRTSPTFVVTDIESDGPDAAAQLDAELRLGRHRGRRHGASASSRPYSARAPDRKPDATTMAWWETQPEAWAAATDQSRRARPSVMPRYADWVESLPGFRVFVAAPMIFDGLWMDHYLDEFAGTRVLGGPFKSRQIFRGGGVCLYTMAGTLRGAPYLDWGMQRCRAEWYGHIAHTHKAIDDARGFANVLVELFEISACAACHHRHRQRLPLKRLTNEIHPRLAQGSPRHRRLGRRDRQDADHGRPRGRRRSKTRRKALRPSSSPMSSRPSSIPIPTSCASARSMPAPAS